jgi:glycosyltransferase involved in cell wall biosynthesis
VKLLLTGEQLARPAPGGIATYVRGLVRGLHALGERPDVLLPRGAQPDVESAAVVNSALPLRLLVQLWDFGLLRPPSGYDLVHATSPAVPARPHAQSRLGPHSQPPTRIGSHAQPQPQSPMTAMVHDLGWRHLPQAYPPRGRRWHEAALRRSLERCRLVFTPSMQTADDLLRDGVDHHRIVVVGLGCDHLAAPDLQAPSRHGVKSQYVLAVGTFEPRKNLERLIAAYASVVSRLPQPMPLVVVGATGWGPRTAPVGNVHFVHGVSSAELSGFYAGAHTFVSVPILEGFGIPPLEAMSVGVPVVSSQVPSIGDAAHVVDPLDVASIAQGILRVVTDDELRAELIARGRLRAAAATWKACAQGHLDAWEKLQ